MLNLHYIPEMEFPDGFLWGSATSAHQIEGNDIHSINWRDQLEHPEVFIHHSGKACNSYELYREDVDLLHHLGHQAYRFSLPWSRIEPEEGKFDLSAVDHYIDLLKRLKSYGIKSFVTISHGSDPAWFWDRGGFADRDQLHFFERYVDFIVPKLDELVDYWMTINEINIMERPGCDKFELRKNYMICHGRAFRTIRKYSSKPVGAPHAVSAVYAKDPHFPADRALADMTDWIMNGFFYHALKTGELVYPYTDAEYFPELKDSYDFWAINYYTSSTISSRKSNARDIPMTCNQLKLIDKEFYMSSFSPDGFYKELLRLKDKPVFITENGCCCDDDRWRMVKMILDLSAVKDAIDAGVDIRGLLHWSLMDNYEWVSFIPRFGMVHVDFKTFKRTPKLSSALFKELIERNGFSPELVKKYLPELPEFKLFNNKK